MIIIKGFAVVLGFAALAVGSIGYANARDYGMNTGGGLYVVCAEKSGCRTTDKYPGRCTGGRKCPGPDETYINGRLVKRSTLRR